jgi:intracellular septation protein
VGKFLFDMLPVALFFVAFKLQGIYWATGVAIVASILQIIYLKVMKKPIEPMQWASLGIITVFGGMTLLFQDETFIKWKPTILYLLFALALGLSMLIKKKNLIKAMMGKQMDLPDDIWNRINWLWTSFFAFMSVLNIWVAYTFSTEDWVNFKMFGTMGLTLLFVIGQALYIGRHMQENN